MLKIFKLLFLWAALQLPVIVAKAQCGGIMEPGFKFLTSSRGCAPFTVNLETLYLKAVPGTVYYIDWADGTPVQVITQTNATGVTISHTYPLASIDCGYDLTIDASNACNPRGSVVPINTQVIVWTNDVVSINPQTFRVCQGFATNLTFTDNSTWNCFPRATRENNEPRWIQWLYGTGPTANQIPGMQVNGVTPGGFPYLNPAPATNPIYPVTAPGQLSLPLNVPATLPADVGREFVVTLKNWNQCNAYDNNLLDLNPFNPVSGNLINGDNLPQVTTARIVIVPSPLPTFVTRLNNATGPVQTTFCIGDRIFFDDNTPAISGASFQYTWRFFDNNTGVGAPLATSTSANPTFTYATGGQKLIRLSVRDGNAAGTCINSVDVIITISPSLIADIRVTDLSNNTLVPDFCQNPSAPLTIFNVRFSDVSVGTPTANTQWRWEFYDQNNVLIRQEPTSGFSSSILGPFDQPYSTRGIYRVRLRVRDNLTACETMDEVQVRVFENPTPSFNASRVCEGLPTVFSENSTLQSINGESIVLREWDFNYNGMTFNKDPAFDNQTSFSRMMGVGGTYQVALRVTTNQNNCSAILVVPVVVDPLPNSSFAPSRVSGCAPLTIVFANNSVTGQPAVIDRFIWEVDARGGLGFQQVGVQRPVDVGFTPSFSYRFTNTTISNKLYDVRLRVITANSCERISAPITITAFPGTVAGFSELNYSPFNDNCSPISVNFRADNQTQSLNPTDYTWTVSDVNGQVAQASTGIDPNFSFIFSNNTTSFKDFSVNLKASLSTGCTGDSTRRIRVSPVPSSLFRVDTLQFDCKLLRVRLTAVQKGLSSYRWQIKENGITMVNQTGAQDNIERTFNRPSSSGTAIAVQFLLDTRNFANCASSTTTSNIAIPIQDNINAGFTATPLSQTLPNATITINNTTNSGPWQYVWDFGDGSPTSNNPNISSHTYATYGVYVISLTVTNNVCVERAAQTITILAIPPIVDFSFDPPSGCLPLKVNFTNRSRFADATTYKWDFGDGNTSTETNPVHVYRKADKFTVTLSASNVTGQIVSQIKQRAIEVFPKPIASFDVKPRVVSIPGGILYTSNRSLDASAFLWDFGDGSTSTEVRPEYRYTQEGLFTIRLIASNAFGCADTTALENVVRTKKNGQVLIPNAFSPNLSGAPGAGGPSSDGKNDTFLPLMRGVTDFELLIYNRWGELLFESKEATRGWDGYYNGKLCPQDVYVYKLTAKLEDGETIVRVGDVNLIR
ncbi:MAG: PKD domain-containing protein [Bacteroidetes bacterium]|nr:PKD domain-containing protein [Bacteroidota bacterium]